MAHRFGELSDLRREWIAHEQGGLAFANTLRAANEKVAQVLSRRIVLHSTALLLIDEMLQAEFGFIPPMRLPDASAAARLMIEVRTDRGPRLVGSLNVEHREALRAYALERITLLQAIISLRVAVRLQLSIEIVGELHHWHGLRSALRESVPA